MKIGIAKKIVVGVLCLATVAVVFLGWAPVKVNVQSAINPWGMSDKSPSSIIEKWVAASPENKAAYDLRTETLKGWGGKDKISGEILPRTINHFQTLREVAILPPWEENTKIPETSILGKTITVYAPDANNYADGWDVNTAFTVDVPADQAGIDALTPAEKKKLVVGLYWYANAQYVNADSAGYYSVTFTDNLAIGLHNRINLDILEIRKNNEMYRQDYRIDGGVDLFAALPNVEKQLNDMLELKCAERRYCNDKMDKTLYVRANNSKLNEKNVPTTDWLSLSKGYTDPMVFEPSFFSDKSGVKNAETYLAQSKPMFEKGQAGVSTPYTRRGYQKCAHTMEADFGGLNDTIMDFDELNNYLNTEPEDTRKFVLKINEWGGITFEVLLNLDDPRSTAYTVAAVRDGAGDQKASYNEVEIKIDLWKNGMYRTYAHNENWSASVMSFAVGSDFLYSDVYFYNEDDCDISKYIETWPEAKAESDAYRAA